jgi:hypothetical protein
MNPRPDKGSQPVKLQIGDMICYPRNGAYIDARVVDYGVQTADGKNKKWVAVRTAKSKSHPQGREFFHAGKIVDNCLWVSRPTDKAPEPTIMHVPEHSARGAWLDNELDAMVTDTLAASAQQGADVAAVSQTPRPADDCSVGTFAPYYAKHGGHHTGMRAAYEWHKLGWDVFSPEYDVARADVDAEAEALADNMPT